MAAKRKQPDGQETREAQPLLMRAAFVPQSVDAENRTVEVDWSTGAEVMRYDWSTRERYIEVLSMDPRHVRLDRLNSGGPVLDSHNAYDGVRGVLGVVDRGSAKVVAGKGSARVRFSKRDDVTSIWDDVRDGILPNLSVGYVVYAWQVERATAGKLERRTAVDWEPFEISFVPIPADNDSQVRSFDDEDSGAQRAQEGQLAMDPLELEKQRAAELAARNAADAAARAAEEARQQQLIGAERQRTADVVALCAAHGVDAERQSTWLRDGVTVDAVRAAILDGIAERERATRVSPATLSGGQRDKTMIRDATDALLLRAGLKVEGDGHRNFAGGSIKRMAEVVLAAGGVNTRTLGDMEIATRALGTGDFSTILNAVGEKLVRAGYDSMPMPHRTAFRQTSAADFRAKNRPVVAAGRVLEKVPESGVIKRTDAKAEMASYAIDTYAGIIPITRKMIINDDFDFVASVSRQRGRSAAETERAIVWKFVYTNPSAPDGTAVFHSSHANTATATSGNAVSAATLAAARKALRKAKAPDGFQIGATLAHLIVGPDTETAWDQLINGAYVPTANANAMTPSLRSLMLHVDPLVVGEDFFGFADYNQVDTFEFAYLAGQNGPRLEQRIGFDVEGLELKVALDFGVGIIDHRGCYWLDGA